MIGIESTVSEEKAFRGSAWPAFEDYAAWLSSLASLRSGRRLDGVHEGNNAQPLVSVVTPVLNGADFIERAIRSVLTQTHEQKEHIIVDGGSTDNTLRIIRDYTDRIACWISEPDSGIYDAMNKGIVLSRGRYIKLLNADDMLPPDSIAKAVSVFERAGDTICVKGNVETVDDADRSIEIVSKGTPLHQSWYVPKRVYEKAGLYRTDFKVSSDYEFFLRTQKMKIEFAHVDEVLIRFRLGGASSGFTGVGERFRIQREYMNTAYATYFAVVRFLRKSRRRLLTRLLGEHGLNNLRRRLRSGRQGR